MMTGQCSVVTHRFACCCPPSCWASSSDHSPSSILLITPSTQCCCEASQVPAVCQRRESFSTIILVLESFLIAGPADSAVVCQFRKMHNGEGRKIKIYIEKRVDVPPPHGIFRHVQMFCAKEGLKNKWKMGSALD